MNYRTLGRTGLKVSEIGFGTWGIGGTVWLGAEDQQSLRALQTARDLGVNFFDTALIYGDGHAEQLLAQAFGKSTDVIIASKVPIKGKLRPGIAYADQYPHEHVQRCLNATLANLGREQIDLYQFHNWSEDWALDTEWQRTVEEFRSSGKVRFVGISTNHHQPDSVLPALETGLIDVVQVIYNIFDQSAEERLFPYCLEHRIGVIARVPLDEGGLTGAVTPQTIFPDGDFRNWYFAGDRKRQIWERIQRIAADAGIAATDMACLALRFCLSHAAVSTVIPGMRTVEHVKRNVTIAEQGPLDSAVLNKLKQHSWQRDFYRTSVWEKLRIFLSASPSQKLRTITKRFK